MSSSASMMSPRRGGTGTDARHELDASAAPGNHGEPRNSGYTSVQPLPSTHWRKFVLGLPCRRHSSWGGEYEGRQEHLGHGGGALDGGFQVRLSELLASRSTLSETASGVAGVAGRLNGLSGIGYATGGTSCAHSFEAMVGLWTDQLTVLARRADELSIGTGTAYDNYDYTETTNTSMLSPGRGS